MLKRIACLCALSFIFSTSAFGGEPDVNTPLGMCGAAINDPLRQMIIDTLVFDGKHLGASLNANISDLENEYGTYLTVNDDATVEKVDESTGKVSCAVTAVVNLQGLAGKLLEDGGAAKAQSLIGQIGREGKVMRRRLSYTVQKTSRNSIMVWLGTPIEHQTYARRRVRHCVYGGICVLWR